MPLKKRVLCAGKRVMVSSCKGLAAIAGRWARAWCAILGLKMASDRPV